MRRWRSSSDAADAAAADDHTIVVVLWGGEAPLASRCKALRLLQALAKTVAVAAPAASARKPTAADHRTAMGDGAMQWWCQVGDDSGGDSTMASGDGRRWCTGGGGGGRGVYERGDPAARATG
ncbi:hypothetical protein HK405_006072 [Cladochytrium tenue]|nr:hypothetical protein HK405_006072 [Cladochytrium tenue]